MKNKPLVIRDYMDNNDDNNKYTVTDSLIKGNPQYFYTYVLPISVNPPKLVCVWALESDKRSQQTGDFSQCEENSEMF